jgi:ABC-2 type transport system permease protein
MKLLDIARKDFIRSFRNVFFLFFGLGVPLLAAGIFYFAFGGLSAGDSGFQVPVTKVQVVNLDQAGPQYGGFSAGQFLVDFLRSEPMAALVEVSEAANAPAARAAVDRQEAGVAVIIPAGLSAAAFGSGEQATIELYQDPTLTLGPAIVKGILRQFVDGFAGTRIAAQVAAEQLPAHGLAVDEGLRQQIALDYGQWAQALGQGMQGGTSALLAVRSPTAQEEPANRMIRLIGLVMSGMMVFYAFYTGAATAMTLLQERESGTLPRLLTTPTPVSAILGGKALSTLALIALQATTLLVFAALVFGVPWGNALGLAMASLGLVVIATGFGIFVNSLLRNTRQAGIVYGGVLTVLGMGGMLTVFTGNVPGASPALDTVSLLTPHGWAVRSYGLLLYGGGPGDVLVPLVVMLALGAAFFAFGVWRFSRRLT